MIIIHYSWHAAFGTLGAVGLAWACVWFFIAEDGPLDAPSKTRGAAAHPILIVHCCFRVPPSAYISAGFAAYWVIALNIVWLANYLIRALHMAPSVAAG